MWEIKNIFSSLTKRNLHDEYENTMRVINTNMNFRLLLIIKTGKNEATINKNMSK